MTYLLAKLGLLKGGGSENNPVLEFFFVNKSREKKRAYLRALRAAQEDQEHTIKTAKEKVRA